MFAASKKLDNLLVMVDYNGIQAVGRSDDISGIPRLSESSRPSDVGLHRAVVTT